MISTLLFETLFDIMCVVGRPFGGIRPRRLYDTIGRRAFAAAAFRWVTNRWGDELYLNPRYHIDRSIIAFGTYDLAVHRVIRALIHPGMVCVDAGANLGEMTLHMARLVGPGGKILAFEPVPRIYRRLCDHVRHNGREDIVQCRATALTDRSGTMAMSIPDEDADNQEMRPVVADKGCATATEVPAATLDEITAGGRVDFIKLDVRGGEWRFLQGAEQTLRRHRPILVTEVSLEDLADEGVTSNDYLLKLASFGYRIHRSARRGVGKLIRPRRQGDNFAATNVICVQPQKSTP